MSDESGTEIGKYRLISKLGEGGMGSVYLAEHMLMGKRVALKLIRPDVAGSAVLADRFINEARAAARILHPGIVQVFDCGLDTQGRAYLAMELLLGESLGGFLRRYRTLTRERTLLRRIARDTALALGAAHAAGIVHRDLKPDNLFLARHHEGPSQVEVKVLDFGVAKLAPGISHPEAHLTQTGALLGTVLYMSPEQCLGSKTIDGRCDIYALGCILFEMAAGRTPFWNMAPIGIAASHVTEPPPRLRDLVPEIDDALDALVTRMLAKDPAERPADMAAVAEELEAGLPPGARSGPITLPSGFTIPVSDREPARATPTTAGLDPTALPAAFVSPPTPGDRPAGVPNNLPAQVTSFVGRKREMAEGLRLFENTRLLTLTGPGGTGKTRLSLQIAAQVADRFPSGVTFVPLAPITDPDLVAPAIVDNLDVETGQVSPRDRLLAHFRNRTALLVMDNFEHVLPAAVLLSELLRTCPGLKVIASSRAPLRISGEQEMPVPPLALADPAASTERISACEAVRLFIERAAATRPSFELTDDIAPTVAEICARLDGLPLAIELAAARVRLLPPATMLTRLESRLDLLQSLARDLPDRQKTLRGAIAWSHDLLDEPCRRLFARLSVFAGGGSLDDVEAICGEGAIGASVLDGLGALVEQSLTRHEDERGEVRVAMLETVREYARERLDECGEGPATRARHAQRFLGLAEAAVPHLLRAERRKWLARLEREHDNLRAAFEFCAGSDRLDEALRLSAALWRFWQFRGHLHEGMRLIGRILADPASARHPRARERAIEGAGGLSYWLGEMGATTRYYEEGVTLARVNGEPARIANALYNISFLPIWAQADRSVAERIREAEAWVSEALALAREADDRGLVARCLWQKANVCFYLLNDLARAIEPLREAVPMFREVGDLFGLAWALHSDGLARLRMGELTAARAAFDEETTLLAEARDTSGVAIAVGDHAQLALAEGNRARAVRLAGASAALRHLTGADLVSMVDTVEGRAIQATAADEDQWQEGLALTLDEAVVYALATG